MRLAMAVEDWRGVLFMAPNVKVKPQRACALSHLGDQLIFALLPCAGPH